MKSSLRESMRLWAIMIAILSLTTVITQAQQEDKVIPVETVASSLYSGVTERMNVVITNKKAWKKLWKQVHSTMSPRPPFPRIDFSEHIVIAIFLGERANSGDRISIVTLVKTGEALKVFTKETLGNPMCPGPPISVQPYHIVVTDLIENPQENVIFEEPEREQVKCH